jgi:hypothetical protein
VSSSDPLAEKALWWTKWQTWLAAAALILGVVLGWTTLRGVLAPLMHAIAATITAAIHAGIRIPFWLLFLGGLAALLLIVRRGRHLEPPSARSGPPSPSRKREQPEAANVGGVIWRWWPSRFHGRVGLLKPFCPHCDVEMGVHEDRGLWAALDRWETTLFCHCCPDARWSHHGRASEVISVTRKIIEAGLRREE